MKSYTGVLDGAQIAVVRSRSIPPSNGFPLPRDVPKCPKSDKIGYFKPASERNGTNSFPGVPDGAKTAVAHSHSIPPSNGFPLPREVPNCPKVSQSVPNTTKMAI